MYVEFIGQERATGKTHDLITQFLSDPQSILIVPNSRMRDHTIHAILARDPQFNIRSNNVYVADSYYDQTRGIDFSTMYVDEWAMLSNGQRHKVLKGVARGFKVKLVVRTDAYHFFTELCKLYEPKEPLPRYDYDRNQHIGHEGQGRRDTN